jgi:hypothetical protein
MSDAAAAETEATTTGLAEYLDGADPEERAAIERLIEEGDPVLRALARAPMGPPDPPEVRAAIDLGRAMGTFVPGADVTTELARRRACEKPGP